MCRRSHTLELPGIRRCRRTFASAYDETMRRGKRGTVALGAAAVLAAVTAGCAGRADDSNAAAPSSTTSSTSTIPEAQRHFEAMLTFAEGTSPRAMADQLCAADVAAAAEMLKGAAPPEEFRDVLRAAIRWRCPDRLAAFAAESAAAEDAYLAAAEADGRVDSTFDPPHAAALICRGTPMLGSEAEMASSSPEVARAAYAWVCPHQLAGLEAAIAAEQERIRVEREAAAQREAEAAAAAAARKAEGISAAEFAQIQPGMSISQVQQIIGSDGEVTVSTEIAGYSGLILSWHGETGDLGANAIMQFSDGVLISKSQYGL